MPLGSSPLCSPGSPGSWGGAAAPSAAGSPPAQRTTHPPPPPRGFFPIRSPQPPVRNIW